MPAIIDLPPATSPPPDAQHHDRSSIDHPHWLTAVGLSLVMLALGIVTGVVPLPQQGIALLARLPGVSAIGPTFAQPARSLPPAVSPTGSVSNALIAPSGCTESSRTVFEQSLDIGRNDWVCGNVTAFGGETTVEGRVGGNVTDVGGSITIAGRVDGDVTAVGGDVTLQAGADVMGNVHAVGGRLHRDTGTTIGGTQEQGIVTPDLPPLQWLTFSGSYTFPWGHLLFWDLAGVAVATMFPRQLRQLRRVAARHVPGSLFAGIAGWVLGAIAAAVLFVTCLGIPIALLLLAALWLASAAGTIAFGLWIGELLLGRSRTERSSPVLATVLGVSLIVLAKSIPGAGGVITVLMWCLGLGAALLALLATRRPAYAMSTMRTHWW
jgi:hypothetical protein